MFVTLSMLSLSMAPAALSQDSGAQEFWADFDKDGYEDLYVLTPGAEDRLLRNNGDGTFADVTERAGLGAVRSTAAEWQDVDVDGHLDLLLVGERADVRVFRGLAGASFEDATETSGLARLQAVRSARFVDFDKDGLQDLRLRTERGLELLHNQGAFSFRAVSLGLPAPAAQTVIVMNGAATSNDAPAVDPGPGAPPAAGGASSGRQSLASTGGSSTSAMASTSGYNAAQGGSATAAFGPVNLCPESMIDQATGSCGLMASSDPTLGMLYPLSSEFFVDSSTGNVGFGTTSPQTPISLYNGQYAVGITQGQVGGSATMELTTTDSSGEQATRLLLRGGSNGDTANVEFYRGPRGLEQPTLTIDGTEGTVSIGGMVEMGSNTGTSSGAGVAWHGSTWPEYQGMIMRRCITPFSTDGEVVARNRWVRLERDGTNGGMRIGWDDDAGFSDVQAITVVASWIDNTGATGSTFESLSTGALEFAGTRQLFTNAENVRHVRITITDTWQGESHTEVSLARWGNDLVWTGHLISSTNQ